MSSQKKMFEATLVTLGDGQVGKTSLIFRYIDNTFSSNYLSTIGFDSKIKKMKLANGEEIKVKIFDTAGQERFRSITKSYIKKANGILLVYDITEEESFKNVEKWYANLEDNGIVKIPVVLIGNKSDLINKREVSFEEGENLSKKFKIGNHFYETSSKTGDNVEIAINDLVQQIYEKYGNKFGNSNIEIKNEESKNDKKKKCC